MTPTHSRAQAAAAYAQLLQEAYPQAHPEQIPAFTRAELSELWLSGKLCDSGDGLCILDFGLSAPNPEGPAVQRAEILCGGERRRGDIALHPCAEDWEREGCGESPAYGNTILHVVLQQPAPSWYTRSTAHAEIPVFAVPSGRLRAVRGCAALYPETAAGKAAALRALPNDKIEKLLRAAAAYRADLKKEFFERKAAVIGQEQAWFEAWAEVLGYAANKAPMRTLARRASLASLQGRDAEAAMLGTAGFLQAVLPERTTAQARDYHRRVWGAWWQLREQFALPAGQELPWVLSPVRPMNHPARRVAALALSARQWPQLLPLMNAAGAKRLTEALCALSHPFWDTHCTLAAAPLRRQCALVGKARAADFLANVVYPQDTSAAAWETYLGLRATDIPARISKQAEALFGPREGLPALLRRHHAQQGLLQLAADFARGPV